MTHAPPDQLVTADGAKNHLQDCFFGLGVFFGEKERGVTVFFWYIVFGLRLVKRYALATWTIQLSNGCKSMAPDIFARLLGCLGVCWQCNPCLGSVS